MDLMITQNSGTGPHIKRDQEYVTARAQMILEPFESKTKFVGWDPATVIRNHGCMLTDFERREITEYPKVYTFGQNANKVNVPYGREGLRSFTDESMHFKLLPNDHISYRYRIRKMIGEGGYSKVVGAIDEKTSERVALKILRKQSTLLYAEIKMLIYIKERDPFDKANCITLLNFGLFRCHVYLVLDCYNSNLSMYIAQRQFANWESLNEVKEITKPILVALCFLKEHSIIHGDLKPGNILLNAEDPKKLKIADFGLSCLEKHAENQQTMQTISYRAPEKFYSPPATAAIDMWSLGCIMGDMLCKHPFLKSKEHYGQFYLIHKLLGAPSEEYLKSHESIRWLCKENGEAIDKDWDPNDGFFKIIDGVTHYVSPYSDVFTPTPKYTMESFFEDGPESKKAAIPFMLGCLTWSPEDRLTPAEAAAHPFLQN